ncbi:MAG: pyridoxamine 5'-phosphate oxidase [Chloroflexi bacterium]|nr:pyridoxamine 5'-phosphate oxidase [Chloroflexota bacterium]
MSCGGFLDLDADPVHQLEAWLAEATQTELREPSAMALATIGAEGDPQVRMVLLRGLDEHGLVFYTDRRSEKGQALGAHPRAAVVLHWEPLERQVRARGTVIPMDAGASAAYFAHRPLGSRIAAWASEQSQPIADRAALEARYAATERRFASGDVPLPEHWGGYRIVPDRFEFWHGRADRLHDRLRYTPRPEGGWDRQRLMP